jgi:hypothetical protein
MSDSPAVSGPALALPAAFACRGRLRPEHLTNGSSDHSHDQAPMMKGPRRRQAARQRRLDRAGWRYVRLDSAFGVKREVRLREPRSGTCASACRWWRACSTARNTFRPTHPAAGRRRGAQAAVPASLGHRSPPRSPRMAAMRAAPPSRRSTSTSRAGAAPCGPERHGRQPGPGGKTTP